MPRYTHSKSPARHQPPQFWIVTLRFLSVTELFLYFLVRLILSFYREIFGSTKSVNNIFKGAREQGRLIRQKYLEEKKLS